MDEYALSALELLAAHIAMVCALAPQRQSILGTVALANPERWSPLTAHVIAELESLCQYVRETGAQLLASDVASSPVAAHPACTELGVAAYAMWPIAGNGGHDIGTIVVFDNKPREWTTPEVAALQMISRQSSTPLTNLMAAASPPAVLTPRNVPTYTTASADRPE